MDSSLFIARLAGPLFIVAGLAILINRDGAIAMGREFMQSRALIYLAGIITLLAGLAIVNTHNLWVADWRVTVTIIGWLSVAGGLFRLLFPGQVQTLGEAMMVRKGWVFVPSLLSLFIGLYLSANGYGLIG